MNAINALKGLYYIRKFKDYTPVKVDYQRYQKWIAQFDAEEQSNVLDALSHIKYFSREYTRTILEGLNNQLVSKLAKEGIIQKNIIYITLSDPGSSSQIMMNLLRDAAGLERRSRILDSRDLMRLTEAVTSSLSGVIVYVDDFSQTGNQFLTERDRLIKSIPAITFMGEYLLIPCICEEAYYAIRNAQVEVIKKEIHDKNQRPFHPENLSFPVQKREKIFELCKKIDPTAPLGYKGTASMIVYFNNTPNGTPVFLRGDVGQKKYIGLLPSNKDLVR